MSGPGPNVRDSPPQASHRQQQMGANKARRSLDTNFHKRQVRTQNSQISLYFIPCSYQFIETESHFGTFIILFLQVQGGQTQGPSVSGHPIVPPAGQATKSTEQPGQTKAHKQSVKQASSHVGPPLRYPGVQDGTKPATKTAQQSKETKAKPAPAGKQTKINAWR